uniref:Adhesion G protein-coupled receptor B2 n=1 Tax=Echeneis naucrates TaxID=173247 RepID=A0A665WSZ7_ECHNA
MNTAGGVCLSVLSCLLAVAGVLAAVSALALAPLSALAGAAHGAADGIPRTGAEGAPSPVSTPCSSLVAGVLYGSFSLRELFPSRAPGCSWSLENPDPTKYSLFLRFTRHPAICRTHSPMLLSLDHHLANQSCPLHLKSARNQDQDVIDLCGSQSNSDGPYTFLQFDKNFVQLCLTRHPAADEPQVPKEVLELRLVEVLLINNENSSQFTCGMLCRWFEECLRTGHNGDEELLDGDGCGMTQTGCICYLHNLAAAVFFRSGLMAPDWKFSPSSCLSLRGWKLKEIQGFMCSLTCGQGWQVRTRSCVSSPYGTLCSGALRETRMCNNTASCPGVPGITGSGTSTEHSILYGLWEEWSSWSLCSVTCGRGSRTRTRKCVNGGGAAACGRPLIQTKLCNIAVCPVEGQWLEWGPWSRCSVTCNTGTQQRQRRCSASVHGWAECKGPHQESRECTNPSCSGGGNWGSWNHWSLCSKTCDSGWQRRFRMCEGTGVQGYPCDGSGEEVRSCNEKKCPAPHEICKDEHLLSMSWKRASAGETVYNKCPTNATGSASRRCMLDNNGVAFWGPPSFARCVSLEYRYLHLSLREHLAKGQRTLAGEGMSQIVRSLLELLQRRSYYSGDLLFSTEILRNVTDTFKRATYIPAPDDVQVRTTSPSNHMHDDVAPGAALLMRILEDFIHLIGEAQKPFQSFLVVTNNLSKSQKAATLCDINFPMKGRRGMKDWARTAEDKLYIPKEVFTIPPEGRRSKTSAAENWGTEGCQTLASTTVHTKCLCSRISTYAVLAQQAKDPVSHTNLINVSLILLSNVCRLSSSLFPLLGRYIRSERSIILVNFCLSILASNLLILVGQSQTLGKGLCTVTAAFLHFFFLASFCWVLTEAWQSYLAVIGKMRSRLIRKRFLCLGWGLPALVVAVSVGFTRARGYGTASYCWLSLEGGLLYAFVGPAAVIVLVNMLIGIVVFNKLMSRDGISDKSKKQRAGASLWSSCVVLPLLALTWMSAVLAITDRRSTLFQVLFAVFDSVQGFVIITVHCAMRREVITQQVRSVANGVRVSCTYSLFFLSFYPASHFQTDFEKDVDLACQTVIFKEVNTCNPATITGTLSRISLDDEDDPKLAAHQEGGVGVNFSSLPGNIPPPNLIVQVRAMRFTLNDKNQKLVYRCCHTVYIFDDRMTKPKIYYFSPQGSTSRRTVSLKPPAPSSQGGLGLGGEDKPLNIAVDDPPFPPPPSPLTLHPAESEAYPADFVPSSVGDMNITMNLNRSYGTMKTMPHGHGHMMAQGGLVHSHGGHMHSHGHSLQLKPGQRPLVRQILTGGTTVERTRTLPRNLGSTNANTSLSAGSLEVGERLRDERRRSSQWWWSSLSISPLTQVHG